MSVQTIKRKTGKGRAYRVRYTNHAGEMQSEDYELLKDAAARDEDIRQESNAGNLSRGAVAAMLVKPSAHSLMSAGGRSTWKQTKWLPKLASATKRS
jgi:hypothetical protein